MKTFNFNVTVECTLNIITNATPNIVLLVLLSGVSGRMIRGFPVSDSLVFLIKYFPR